MYDTIVIGAGSAGAVIAGRLSEDEGRRVLLLEAGPDYRSHQTPKELQSIEPLVAQPTDVLRDAHTYPKLMATRTSVQSPAPYVRGRGVGGSSAVNGLFAIRPTREDFDGWAASGCRGWAFDDVLPALNRLEADGDYGDRPYHGDHGPIPIRRPRREDFGVVEAAVDAAAAALGHRWEPDHNAPGTTGVSPYAFNARGRRRVSTNDAYLEPARDRANLRVIGGAIVDRVLIEGDRTAGVRAIVAGEVIEFASREVVVSAGAIHSPALLLRSGIGPAAQLRALGVRVVADLPVGLNLQEHASIALVLGHTDPADYGTQPSRGQLCLRFTTGVGDETNDAMIVVAGALGVGVPASGLIGWVNRADSTGRVRLASLDPTVEPVIDFDLLSDDRDLQRFRAVVEELRALAGSSEVGRISTDASLGPAGIPARTAMSDREFREFALANVADTVHAVGTCRMGAPDGEGVVVDPTGAVLGVEGLRVADTSILPWVPRANTHLAAVVAAEHIASLMTTDIQEKSAAR